MKQISIILAVFLILAFIIPASASIPPTPVSCSSLSGATWVNVSCSAGVGNVTDALNFTNVNLGTWSNGTAAYWNNTGLSEGTSYEYNIYGYNGTGAGNLSISYATATKSTSTTPGTSSINLTSITADFVSVGGIIDASVIIFEALMGLVIALIPIVIAIAIAKFIPGIFTKVLDMFRF